MKNYLRDLEAVYMQAVIVEILVGAIATAFMFWLLYLAIRSGVRDGIKDGLAGTRAGRRHPTKSVNLPDMRAD